MARTPAPKTRIQRAGNGHSYYLEGTKVPGVTTIIGNGVPKNALQAWAARTTAEFVVNRLSLQPDGTLNADQLAADLRKMNDEAPGYRKEKLGTDGFPVLSMAKVLEGVRFADRDAAARRGTEVHGLAEKLARGDEIEVPEEIAGYVESYIKFLDQWDPRNALLERVFINRRWKYMGKGDMIADFHHMAWPDNHPKAGEPMGRGLLDIKTTRSGIFADVAFQVEAYAHCETMMVEGAKDGEEEPMPHIDFVGAIHVRSDGYSVHTFDRGDDDKGELAFRTFLYAKQVGEFIDFKTGPASWIKSDALDVPSALEEE